MELEKKIGNFVRISETAAGLSGMRVPSRPEIETLEGIDSTTLNEREMMIVLVCPGNVE